MLAAPIKKAKPVDWTDPLRGYLLQHYAVSEVDRQSGSIQRLNSARERITTVKRIDDQTLVVAKAYLKMLGSVQTRFPVTENDMKINFTWYDSFKPTKKFTSQRITSEKAAMLFNLAAMESYVGMQADRTNPEGLKKACTHFQAAAGIFTLLRDSYVPNHVTGPRTADLSEEGLSVLISLMLAQAQACFFEKAVRNKMAASVLTKLAGQAQKFYTDALRFSASPGLQGILDRSWGSHLEFQSQCFAASSEYQFSKVQFENAEKTGEGYGLRIAWLKSANSKCSLAIETAKSTGLPDSMLGTVQSLQAILNREYAKAIQDNNDIYMEMIPQEAELGVIPVYALAKPSAVDESLYMPIVPGTEEGEDAVFKDLLPAEMQEAEAIYQSKLSNLVQQSGKAVEQSVDNVRERLAEANLPAAVEAGDTTQKGVPEQTWRKIRDQVQNRGGIASLNSSLDSNGRLGQQIASKLSEIDSALRKEEADDAKYRQTWGDKWTITPSQEINKHLKLDATRYRGLLSEATNSDSKLRNKIREKSTLLDTVNMPKEGIDLLMPAPGEVDEDPKVEGLRMELSLLLVKLGDSVQDAKKMQSDLKEATKKDSIVPLLANSPYGVKEIVNNTQRLEALMDEKMQVHVDVVSHIKRMVEDHTAQLSRIFDKNHAFMASRNETDATRKRQEVLAQLEAAVTLYSEIYAHIEEGKKFYQNLTDRVDQLVITVKDHVFSRKLQHDELEQHVVSGLDGGGRPGLGRQTSIPQMSEYVSSAGVQQGLGYGGSAGGGFASTTYTAPQPTYTPTPTPTRTGGGGGGNTASDEELARRLQEEFNREAGGSGGGSGGGLGTAAVAGAGAGTGSGGFSGSSPTSGGGGGATGGGGGSGGLSDEDMARQLAQEQLVENQRQLLIAAAGGGGGGGGFGNKDYTAEVAQMRAILGDGIKEKALIPFLEGAGGDVSVAINHYMEAETSGKLKSGKKGGGARFGRNNKKKEKKPKKKGGGGGGSELW